MRLQSLKLKIILSSAASILVVVILSTMLLYQYLSKIISEKADNLDSLNLETVQSRMNQELLRFDNFGGACANDLDIARALRHDSLKTLAQKNDGIKAQDKLWSFLSVTPFSPYIDKLMAFNDSGLMVQTAGTRFLNSPRDAERVRQTRAFNDFRESGEILMFAMSESVVSGAPCLIYLCQIYDSVSAINRGWLYMEISPRWITDVATPRSDGVFFLTDGSGRPLPDVYADAAFEEAIRRDASGHGEEFRYDNKVYKLRSVPLATKGLKLYNLTDITFLKQDGNAVFFTTLVVASASLLVALMLSFLLSELITRPLNRLNERIIKIAGNDFSHDPEIERGNDEIARTGQMINRMSSSIQHLLEETESMYLQQKNAEIALLQSQVNPHFLYNTLDSIHWMASIQKNAGIMTITRSLSALLKNLAKGVGNKITLGEELSLVSDYVSIQLIRYIETFRLENRIASEFYKYNIIKFTLQPLVENAIFHGIEPKGECGVIVLDAEESGSDLLITVTDDGIGMTPDELQRLDFNGDGHKRSHFSGIGVPNVDNRIKLVYGSAYGLNLESTRGIGTRVTVRIPKEM